MTLAVVLFTGCDKYQPYDTVIPEGIAHFNGASSQIYSILVDPTPVLNIEVGTTDKSGSDRTVNYTITSPTGARSGTEYAGASSGTLTFPANQTIANIPLQANFDAYTTGRIDTLIVALQPNSLSVAEYADTIRVIMRGPCFEGDIVLDDLLGDWNAVETFGSGSPYGPYPVTTSGIVPLSPTTASITVSNIWNNGWAPITFTLDWTDTDNPVIITPTNFTIGGSDCGDISAAYAGTQIWIRPIPGNVGTFSWCDQRIVIRGQLGPTGLGYFTGNPYVVTLTR